MRNLIFILSAIILIVSNGCNNPEKSFAKAVEERQKNDFDRIIIKFPESEFSIKAKEKITDIEFWSKIDSSLIVMDYKTYLDSFPNALFKNEAELMMQEISIFDSTREQDILMPYISFQEKYPASLFNDNIISRLEVLEQAHKEYILLQDKYDIKVLMTFIKEFSETGYGKLIQSRIDSLNTLFYKQKGQVMPDLISFSESFIKSSIPLMNGTDINLRNGYKFILISTMFKSGLIDELTIDLDSIYITLDNKKIRCTASGIFYPYFFRFEKRSVGIRQGSFKNIQNTFFTNWEWENNLVQLSGFSQDWASYKYIFEVPDNFELNEINWYGRDLIDTKNNVSQTVALNRNEQDAINLAVVKISKVSTDIKLIKSPGDTINHELKISHSILERLPKYNSDQLDESISVDGVDMSFEDDGVKILIPQNAAITVKYNGFLNEDIQFVEGEIGISNGDIYIKDGTTAIVNEKSYRYNFAEDLWITSAFYQKISLMPD